MEIVKLIKVVHQSDLVLGQIAMYNQMIKVNIFYAIDSFVEICPSTKLLF